MQVGLIINDRVDVALAVGADGVHVGQDDIPAKAARALLGPHKILGVSVKTVEQAQQAAADGADYLGAGASQCLRLHDCNSCIARSRVCSVVACDRQIMSPDALCAWPGICLHTLECLSCQAGVSTHDLVCCLRSGKLPTGGFDDAHVSSDRLCAVLLLLLGVTLILQCLQLM